MSFQLARIISLITKRETAVVIDIVVLPWVNYVRALTFYLRENPVTSYCYSLEETERNQWQGCYDVFTRPFWEQSILESYSVQESAICITTELNMPLFSKVEISWQAEIKNLFWENMYILWCTNISCNIAHCASLIFKI